MPEAKESPVERMTGRVVKRWVAECDYRDCLFAERQRPTLHTNVDSAMREARDHAIASEHVGAREVSVRRKYSPRVVQSEEIVE